MSTRSAERNSLRISVPTRCSPRAFTIRSVQEIGIAGRSGDCAVGSPRASTTARSSRSSPDIKASGSTAPCWTLWMSASKSWLTTSRASESPFREVNARCRTCARCWVRTRGTSADSTFRRSGIREAGRFSKRWASPRVTKLSYSPGFMKPALRPWPPPTCEGSPPALPQSLCRYSMASPPSAIFLPDLS
jgi:hypothetical protein